MQNSTVPLSDDFIRALITSGSITRDMMSPEVQTRYAREFADKEREQQLTPPSK